MFNVIMLQTVQGDLFCSSNVLSQFAHQHVVDDKVGVSVIIRSLLSLHSYLYTT